MAYDRDLADRIRALLATEPDVTERAMFGGLAFLVGGNMAVTASHHGGLLVRVAPGQRDDVLASTNATIAVMGSRAMRGWLHVADADVRRARDLATWVARGVAEARTRPPDARRAPRARRT